MNFKTLLFRVLLIIAFVVLISIAASRAHQQREWFRIQAEQVAAFQSLERFPPKDLDSRSWRSAIDTPVHVWINATYHPNHSHISNAEMRTMLNKVQAIVSKATTENGIQCVDDVLSILAERDHMKGFVLGYRDEFRSQFAAHFGPPQ